MGMFIHIVWVTGKQAWSLVVFMNMEGPWANITLIAGDGAPDYNELLSTPSIRCLYAHQA